MSAIRIRLPLSRFLFPRLKMSPRANQRGGPDYNTDTSARWALRTKTVPEFPPPPSATAMAAMAVRAAVLLLCAMRAFPLPPVSTRASSLQLLRTYSSELGREGSARPLVELSAGSKIHLEFDVRHHDRTRTLLWSSLRLASPDVWDGRTPSAIGFGVSVVPQARAGDGMMPPAAPATALAIELQNGVSTWTREITESVRPMLQASSLRPTEPTAASHSDWDWPVMPRYQGTDGRNVMQLILSWTSSTSSSYIQFATERYRTRHCSQH